MKPNLLIRASAGSGKTRKLSLRYLELIVKGAPISTVLASTFTRKATGEILNRILLTAAQACSDEILRHELSENVGREISVAEMTDIMRRLVQGLNQIRACSLSSFFHRIALCFPYEMGLKPGWRILDDVEDAQLRWNAIHETLAQNERNISTLVHQLFKGESKSQLADEIFGKMRDLLTLEISASPHAWEELQRLPVRGVLNEAEIVDCLNAIEEQIDAPEMEDKDKRLPGSLRKIAEHVRTNNWNELLKLSLIRHVYSVPENESIPFYGKPLNLPKVEKALRFLAYHVASQSFSLLKAQLSSAYTLVTGFAENYNRAKLSVNALQFEDVTRLVAEFVARQNGNLQPLYWRMNAPVNHLLLDEFQDTSLDQWHIFQPFGERCTSGEENRSFFCVGDVKQAIYRWRNGRAEIFDAIEKTFPGIEQESSNMSWRSAPEILRCVNRFFLDPTKQPVHDEGRAECGRNVENYEPEPIASGNDAVPVREFMSSQAASAWDGWRFEKHIPSPKSAKYPGYWELRAMPPKPSKKEFAEMMKGRSDYRESNYDSDSDSEDFDSSYELNDEYTPKPEDVQWRWVAKQIAEHYRQWRGMYRVGVLFRNNQHISRLARFLREEGIAVSEEGKNPLTNSNAVCLVLSLLTLMDFPESSMSWFHVGNSSLVALYPELRWQDVKRMESGAREKCLAELSECLSKLREEFQAFGVGAFVEKLSFALQPFCTTEEERRLTQLRNLAASYGQNSRMRRIAHFIDYVLGFKMEDPSGASVTLMSIHGSKGLQFDAVFLPEVDFLVSGRAPSFVPGYVDDDVLREISLVTPFPGENIRNAVFSETSPFYRAMTLDERDRIRENFSLLYVAMTRAIYAMYLLVPPQGKRKKKTDSFNRFGHLLCMGLAGVEQVEAEELVAWDGDPEWYNKTAQAVKEKETVSEKTEVETVSERVQKPKKDTSVEPIVFRESQFSSRDLVRRAPSNIEDRRMVNLGKKLDFSQQNTVNGSILHGWYEKIAWVENSLPSDEELIAVARPYGLTKDRLERLLKSFHSSLKSPKLDRVLHWTTYIPMLSEKVRQAGILPEDQIPRTVTRKRPDDPEEIRWEVYREKELAIRTETELLLGTLDRLILLRNDAQVFWADCIDYKTTRKINNPDVLEEKVRSHSLQMQDYRHMLQLHYRIPSTQISTHLVFSMLGIVREVPCTK